MPWFNFQISEAMKKRMASYLINYYLGSFLDVPISLEDLSLSLFQGEVKLNNINLDVAAINDGLEEYNMPFEFIEGYIEEIGVRVPWTSLLSDSTIIDVHGFEITIRPKKRSEDESMCFESMLYNSMTASMQERCMMEDTLESSLTTDDVRFMGPLDCAQAIDAIVSRIRVRFFDTLIRLEHVPKDSMIGAALEVKIARIEYFDDMAENDLNRQKESHDERKHFFESAAFGGRTLQVTGVQVFCDQHKAEPGPTPRAPGSADCRDSSMHRMDSFSESAEFSNMLHKTQPVVTSQPTGNGWAPNRDDEDLPDPILIMELSGTQEIKIRIKCKEDLPGPKVDLECRLGFLHAFLSPQLLHMLTGILGGISSPGVNENPNVPRAMTKKMDAEDYKKVEKELRRGLPKQNAGSSIVRVRQHLASTSDDGLSNQPIDDDEYDDDSDIYMSVANNWSGISGSSSMESSIVRSSSPTTTCSTGSRSGVSHSRKRSDRPISAKSKLSMDDSTTETNKLKIKLGFISAIILHEDPSTNPPDPNSSLSALLDPMREAAKKYFAAIKSISLAGISTAKDLADLRGKFSAACQKDHLSILGKSVLVDVTQQTSPSVQCLTSDICMSLLEVVDGVFSNAAATASFMGFHLPIENVLPDYCELLVFPDNESSKPLTQNAMFSSMHVNNPCIKLRYRSTEFSSRKGSRRRGVTAPKTELQIDLADNRSELDITLVDRIHAIINPKKSSASRNNGFGNGSRSVHLPCVQPDHSMFSQALDDEDHLANNRTLDLQIASSSFTLDIRFPKVDLSSHRVERPWWQRSLHPERLRLVMDNAKFKSTLNNMDTVTAFEFTWRHTEGSFQLVDRPPIIFLRIANDDVNSDGFNWPRMMIRLSPAKQSVLENTFDEKYMLPEPEPGEYMYMRSESLPFSSKKVMYDNKELLCPGNRRDMMEFQDKSLINTIQAIELTLPSFAAFLPSKDFFEVIYNRLLNDLLLWEPAAPIPKDVQEPYSLSCGGSTWSPELVTQMMNQRQMDDEASFSASGDGYDSSSETDENDEFFSVNDPKSHQHKRRTNGHVQQPSKLCLTLNIGHGSLTAMAPIRDEEGAVRKDVHGEFLLEVEDFALLAVVGHGGDPEVQYICSQIRNVNLFHCGMNEVRCENPDLNYIMQSSCDHLLPTIYLSEDGVPTRLRGKVGRRVDTDEDMFSLTIKITSENFTSQKNYLVAAGLRGTTLRHRMSLSGLSWWDQLMDFFNVVDFDIPGYTLPKIVTELHCYLWGCAIDYRPIGLPIKSLFTIESFSFMSNIIAESSISVLRFLLDDASLYLSDKNHIERVDVKNDYVCIGDLGAFEIALHMSNGQNPSHPKVDFSASNNVINIRTCSDSAAMLAGLINYLARRGDLEIDGKAKKELCSTTPTASLSNLNLTDSDCLEENLPDLMEEAMQDVGLPTDDDSSSDSDDESLPATELYFMPRDDMAFYTPRRSSEISMPSSSSTASRKSRKPAPLRTASNGFTHLDDTFSDEEFCIIDEPGLGNKPRNGEPITRIYAKEPIVVRECHFTKPLTKTDLLKAPVNFPPAVNRYTVKEISVVWHMFGGRDFESSPMPKHTSGSPKSTPKNKANKYPAESLPWQHRGGPGRDHSTLMELHLNKMRLQHEIYPEDTLQAARQVLLINEIEVIDKLALSDINKFFYLYSSDSLPRQSHANMLMIKALHVRPDLARPHETECSVKVTCQPIRLNVDQDALFFFRNFFTELSSGRGGRESDSRPPSSASVGRPRSGEPPSSVNSTPKRVPSAGQPLSAGEPGSPEPLMTFDDFSSAMGKKESREGESKRDSERDSESTSEDKPLPIYFKSFEFTHDVPIRLDYHGKWVDMEQGTVAGLVVGLAQLNCTELRLKRFTHKCGLLGFDRLVMFALSEWLGDIKKHQLPNLLVGVGPMHSLYQLVHGCRDFFWMPIEQYRKDGRIMRGLQRGTSSFVTCTAMSMLELTNRFVQTVQNCAETAYDLVSPGPSVHERKKSTKRRRGFQHPADLREGLTNAVTIFKEGVCETATTMYTVAVEEHEHKGMTGAIGGIIRQFPSTVIKPVIFTSEATSNILGGMRNQIHPDRKKEDEEKWKALPTSG